MNLGSQSRKGEQSQRGNTLGPLGRVFLATVILLPTPGAVVTNGKNWPCNRTVGVVKQRKHRVGGTKKAPRPATTPLTYKARRKGNARAFVGTSPWKVQDVGLSVNRCLLFPVCTSKGICQHPLWKPTEAAFTCPFLFYFFSGKKTWERNRI